jgi:hypothetical protein
MMVVSLRDLLSPRRLRFSSVAMGTMVASVTREAWSLSQSWLSR